MSEQKLESVKKEIETLSVEISKLKDEKCELGLREGLRVPEQIYKIEMELKEKENKVRSLEETARGLSLRIKKLPELRLKIREIKKRVKELDARGLKALELLEKRRRQVKEDVHNLQEINREFRKLQAMINEISREVDPEELLNVSAKRSFAPPKNAVYFAENKSIVSKW